MATTDTDTFSSVSNYYLELYTSLSSQSVSGNYSNVYYRLRVRSKGSGGYWSGYDNSSGSVRSSEGTEWSDSAMTYDFRNGDYWTFASGYVRIPHRSDGTGSYSFSASMNLYLIGSASVSTGTIGLPALADVPPAPTGEELNVLSSSSLYYRFRGNGNGGSSILQWQIGISEYSTIAGGPWRAITSDGTHTITGLDYATTYNVWSRGRNAVGWGPWSNRLSARTLAIATPAPSNIELGDATQTSLYYEFRNNGNGGSTTLEWQIGYGKSSSGPEKYLSSTGKSTVTGLDPATTYYFWSRGRNAIGWGPWSPRISAKTKAGAQVKVSGVWRGAIPYVKVNGVWKLAQPYVRHLGVWKKTH